VIVFFSPSRLRCFCSLEFWKGASMVASPAATRSGTVRLARPISGTPLLPRESASRGSLPPCGEIFCPDSFGSNGRGPAYPRQICAIFRSSRMRSPFSPGKSNAGIIVVTSYLLLREIWYHNIPSFSFPWAFAGRNDFMRQIATFPANIEHELFPPF